MRETRSRESSNGGLLDEGRLEHHPDPLVRELSERCQSLERERADLYEHLARLEPAPKPPRRVRSYVSDALFVLLAGLVVAAAAVAIAIASGLWKLHPASGGPVTQPAASGEAPAATTARGGTAATPSTTAGSTAASAAAASSGAAAATEAGAGGPVELVADALAGDSWLQVRRASATGTVVWEGILPQGESATFEGRRLWLRVGDPSALRLVLNGEVVQDLPLLTADLLATPRGVRVVSQD